VHIREGHGLSRATGYGVAALAAEANYNAGRGQLMTVSATETCERMTPTFPLSNSGILHLNGCLP